MEQNPYPWQTWILNYIQQKAIERQVLWVFDAYGRNGKSTLVKYLAYKKEALVLGPGEKRDLFFARSEKRDSNLVIFDLTRKFGMDLKDGDIFDAIEQIKNGVFFSAKYESATSVTARFQDKNQYYRISQFNRTKLSKRCT